MILKHRSLTHLTAIPIMFLAVALVIPMHTYIRIAIAVVMLLWLLHITSAASILRYCVVLEGKEKTLKDMRMLFDNIDTNDVYVNNLLHIMMVIVSGLNLTNISIEEWSDLGLQKGFNDDAYVFMKRLLTFSEESLQRKKRYYSRLCRK